MSAVGLRGGWTSVDTAASANVGHAQSNWRIRHKADAGRERLRRREGAESGARTPRSLLRTTAVYSTNSVSQYGMTHAYLQHTRRHALVGRHRPPGPLPQWHAANSHSRPRTGYTGTTQPAQTRAGHGGLGSLEVTSLPRPPPIKSADTDSHRRQRYGFSPQSAETRQ